MDSYSDRETDCIFCELGAGRIIAENELCIAIKDAFPVTEHHTLVIPKRHVSDYFDLHQPERNAIEAMLHEQRQSILEQDNTVTGFNVGINAGASAGQTVFHVHVHLIPSVMVMSLTLEAGYVGLSQASRGIEMFNVGEKYSRARDIHDQYGGTRQSGISPSGSHPFIFLFTGDSGETYGYEDGWQQDEGVFLYTGQGQVGDMEFVRGNKAIRDHIANGKQLFLFKAIGKGKPVEF